ncbi:MAG: ROK family protein, partial [Trueperaceae bacterium]
VFPTPGSVEWHLGATWLSERTGGRYAANEDLLADLQAGRPEAEAEWARMVRALAVAVAGIVNAFDSERVIIGGGLAQSGDALFGPLAQELDAVAWRPNGLTVPVVPARLGRHAGSIGAALFGRERSA